MQVFPRGLRNGAGIALDDKEERRRHDRIVGCLEGALEPDALASQTALLFEGAIASMLVRQDPRSRCR